MRNNQSFNNINDELNIDDMTKNQKLFFVINT